MSDRSDKDLGRHIRAVFDAYEEPYDPASWRQLQRRRRGKAAAVYLKWAGAAASVAVLLAAGVLLWNNYSVPEGPLQVNEIPQAETSGGGSGGELPEAGNEITAQLPPAASANNDERPAAVSGPAAGAPAQGETPVSGEPPHTGNYFSAAAEAAAGAPSADEEAVERDAANGEGLASPGSAIAGAGVRPAADPSSGAAAASETKETERAAVPENEAAADVNPFPQAEDLAATGNDPATGKYPAYETDTEEKAAAGRFSVGFVTTSLMNYASGNTGSQVHFGAGITSGWQLSERLSLHSGVILAENSLSLNNSNSSVQASSYAADAAPANNLSAVGKNSIVQNVSPQSMDVNLLVMDVPLNLTYRLGLGKTDLLLTGGLSSFAYLDQEYSYHNTVQLYTNATVAAPEPVVRNEKAFSHFDLARQLNLAIGTEVPLGKGSVLIVEPYVKYPLGELTSEHIKFGSAGMNLRLSFQTGN